MIKRHYTQPYALGHEIVHSWIGNGVFNRIDRGNWVEGLTTYLSNYYYHELMGDEAQAREQRRLMLMGYAVYVRPGEEYPVIRFAQKHDEKDNAIGYQQSAMVFHALRQEIGEAAFWKALKQIPEQYLGRAAEWRDLERILQDVAGRDLRWFFAQWVERAGAPEIELTRVWVQPSTGTSGEANTVEAMVHIAQHGVPYRIAVDLEFVLDGGRAHRARIHLTEAQQDVVVHHHIQRLLRAACQQEGTENETRPVGSRDRGVRHHHFEPSKRSGALAALLIPSSGTDLIA